MSEFSISFQIVLALLSIGVPGLVVWVWALWRDHTALKLKVAEEYPKNSTLSEIKNDLHDLRIVVFKIAERLEIPAVGTYQRR